MRPDILRNAFVLNTRRQRGGLLLLISEILRCALVCRAHIFSMGHLNVGLGGLGLLHAQNKVHRQRTQH